MPRLKSMDVTIGDVTRSYDFGSGIEVSTDDEGEASLEALREAYTTEVVLGGVISSATVTIDYTYTTSGSVQVDLEDLDGIEDADDLVMSIEQGNFDYVEETVLQDVSDDIRGDFVTIDSVEVTGLFDEDGDDVQ